MKKRLPAIIAAAFALLILMMPLTACGQKTVVTYSTADGFSVTMHEGMEYFTAEGFDAAWSDEDCMVCVLREGFDEYEDCGLDLASMSLEEYADLTAGLNGLEPFTADEFGNRFTTYSGTADGEDYFYHAVVYKGSDSFWLVTFACRDDLREDYAQRFTLWSSTVTLP